MTIFKALQVLGLAVLFSIPISIFIVAVEDLLDD